MKREFVIKDLDTDLYYTGVADDWSKRMFLADRFETGAEAEKKIDSLNSGYYSIVLIYVVE